MGDRLQPGSGFRQAVYLRSTFSRTQPRTIAKMMAASTSWGTKSETPTRLRELAEQANDGKPGVRRFCLRTEPAALKRKLCRADVWAVSIESSLWWCTYSRSSLVAVRVPLDVLAAATTSPREVSHG